MKQEIEGLQDRLVDHSDHKEEQQSELKNKLVSLHTADVDNLKDEHEEHKQTLNKEIEQYK